MTKKELNSSQSEMEIKKKLKNTRYKERTLQFECT